jgi:hypothetical protein
MLSNALTTNFVRRHVVLDTLTTTLTKRRWTTRLAGSAATFNRSRRRRRPWRAAARCRRRPSAVFVSLLCVRTLPVLIDMFASFLAMLLEEADVAPQLDRLERQVVPVAVEGTDRAAAAAAR